jgi:hypothetical protein
MQRRLIAFDDGAASAAERAFLGYSDQGAQYTARNWLNFLKAYQFKVSIRQRGSCHENAVAKSFFSSLKLERVRKNYSTRAEVRLDLVQCIEGGTSITKGGMAKTRTYRTHSLKTTTLGSYRVSRELGPP